MNAPVWRVEDDGEVQLPASATAEAGLVSLPFLVAAIRRRLATRGRDGSGLCPPGSRRAPVDRRTARRHGHAPPDQRSDDRSELRDGHEHEPAAHARASPEEVVKDLNLADTPESFGATVTAAPLSDQLMTVTVTAPSAQEAITRVNQLASVYLAFRGEQLSAFANSTIQANQKRIDSLNAQIAQLSKKYDAAASTPARSSWRRTC